MIFLNTRDMAKKRDSLTLYKQFKASLDSFDFNKTIEQKVKRNALSQSEMVAMADRLIDKINLEINK